MHLKNWYKNRGSNFLLRRGTSLVERYGITPTRSFKRINDCLETLIELDCAPTFPTPGILVQRHPKFFRNLQEAGAEIAVHGYQHFDLSSYSPADACSQLMRATQTFERHHIEAHGFRCPYIGCTEELIQNLPGGQFEYSSNQTINWGISLDESDSRPNVIFKKLSHFYQGESAKDVVCMPWTRPNLIEIPCCVPDDLQLRDGISFGSEGIERVWKLTLYQTHQRGELFTLVFHLELASFCESPFIALVNEAKKLSPFVWIARLRDISDWWREKSSFKIEVSQTESMLHLSFICSPRATILIRDIANPGSYQAWDGQYYRLQGHTLDISADPLPFIGVPESTPNQIVTFLQEQGYILDASETAPHCSIYLDEATLSHTNQVQLIDTIESSPGPLVRYWRWPEGAKSALSITGDLDALSLIDYASRFFSNTSFQEFALKP